MENEHKPPRKKKKLKKLELEEKAREKGRILGQIAAHKKKPWMESFKEHLGHWIDNINPVELAAILGLTVIVKATIDQTEVLLTKLKEFAAANKIPAEYRKFHPIYREILGEEAPTIWESIWGEGAVELAPEWFEWLFAFTMAYIIIKHGGQLLGLMKEGGGTIATVVGALMGVVI